MKHRNLRVICKNEQYGTMDFYLRAGERTYFLFRTPYFSMPIFRAYSGGCALREVFRKTHCERQSNLREHILRNVRALEAELGIERLDRPWQRKRPHRRKRGRREQEREWLDAA